MNGGGGGGNSGNSGGGLAPPRLRTKTNNVHNSSTSRRKSSSLSSSHPRHNRYPASAAALPWSSRSWASSNTRYGMSRHNFQQQQQRQTSVCVVWGCLALYAALVMSFTHYHLEHSQQQNLDNENSESLSFSWTHLTSFKDQLAQLKALRSSSSGTQQQQQQQQQQHSSSSSSSNNNKQQPSPQAQQQRRRDTQQQQQQQQQALREKVQTKNPIRKQHLENQFGHGVQPQAFVLEHDSEQADESQFDAFRPFRDDIALDQHPTPDTILTAYIETINYTQLLDFNRTTGLPPREYAHANLLTALSYSRVNSCSKLTQQWPVDDGPTDLDPFLPWIHDVFPTDDGRYIQIVAQNKRRCRSGTTPSEKAILQTMQPQAALFQHVPVQRRRLESSSTETRYVLVDHPEADPDGVATRYVCRFHPGGEETLSEFNLDYDWAALRKRYRGTFVQDDAGIKSIHTSQLLFQCPVPLQYRDDIANGRHVHRDWTRLFVDIIPLRTPPRFGKADQYFQPRYREFQTTDVSRKFDPRKEWGPTGYLQPRLNDAGRWQHVPICLPSHLQYGGRKHHKSLQQQQQEQQVANGEPVVVQPILSELPRPQKHRLVSCLWASSGYATRGNRFAVNDGQRRLLEWIAYNRVIGFDHFYLYDNSGAFYDHNAATTGSSSSGSTPTSLKPIADLLGPDIVTYIPWPSQVCNNNPNNVDSVGERSSQYAAESSCRLRFGPYVEWIGQFDVDEYLVPMGKHSNITSLLDQLDREDTRIISFGSWRAWPRWEYIEQPIEPIKNKHVCWSRERCFHLKVPRHHTYLQTYNCDRQPPGKKTEVMPAEKQLYRANYVTQHFVHYAAVTVLSEKNASEYAEEGFRWKWRAFPDPRQRFGDEVKEGLMLHAKAVAVQDTAGYERLCDVATLDQPPIDKGLCRVGLPWPKPWPKDPKKAEHRSTPKEHWAYNCFVNDQVEEKLVPRLEKELAVWHSKLQPGSVES